MNLIMKRYSFSQNAGVAQLVSIPVINPFQEMSKIEKDSQNKDSVFNMIYAPDSVTGIPRSDLGTYLTEETNPLVRDFIERQLRNDLSAKTVSPPKEISDYEIAYLTRDRNEPIGEYVSRVNQYCARQKAQYQANKRAAMIRSRMPKKASVEPVKE